MRRSVLPSVPAFELNADPPSQIAKATGLINRLEFRRKFESIHEPMFVCYPEDGFGLDGVKALLRALKK